jgi:hypothetical protein
VVVVVGVELPPASRRGSRSANSATPNRASKN